MFNPGVRDYITLQTEQDQGSYLLAEAWVHGNYPWVHYLQVDRTQADVVFQEQPNKIYNPIGPFPARIVVNPTIEMETDYGVNWEEGEILVKTPRWFLQQIVATSTAMMAQTVDQIIANDDRISIPDVYNSDQQPKVWSIKQIKRDGYYGSEALMVNMICIAVPADNQ